MASMQGREVVACQNPPTLESGRPRDPVVARWVGPRNTSKSLNRCKRLEQAGGGSVCSQRWMRSSRWREVVQGAAPYLTAHDRRVARFANLWGKIVPQLLAL